MSPCVELVLCCDKQKSKEKEYKLKQLTWSIINNYISTLLFVIQRIKEL